MKTFDGREVDDPNFYHPGIMTDDEVLAAVKGPPESRRIPYVPDDPRVMDQRPYLAFAARDTTPTYQREDAR